MLVGLWVVSTISWSLCEAAVRFAARVLINLAHKRTDKHHPAAVETRLARSARLVVEVCQSKCYEAECRRETYRCDNDERAWSALVARRRRREKSLAVLFSISDGKGMRVDDYSSSEVKG